MPLINGQKMACEPCIRGHRSTKCTHADERLMVPVRKPGRPLSSCPHPSSRRCSCAAVTAAIPRKQKCRCGTSQPPDPDDTPTPPSADLSPPSPSKTAASAFRVQKQPSKTAPSRKQSVDLAGLGRMDASQLNIRSPYNGIPTPASVSNGAGAHQMPPLADMSLYGLGLAPIDGSFSPEPTMFPMFPYSVPSAVMAPNPAKPITNGHATSSTNGAKPGRAPSTPGGCCGAAPPPTSSPSSATNGAGETKAKASCCSAATDSLERRQPADAVPAPGAAQQPNGVMMSPFQPPMAMPGGMYPYFSHPTIFNYPPQFGSFLQPLQPEQWRQFMAAMSFAQPAPPSAFGLPGPYGASSAANLPGTPGGTPWTSHQCSCGESCQCVGCAAHPYNEATQNYVRSAWSTVIEDGWAETSGAASHFNEHADESQGQPASQTSNEATAPAKRHAEGAVSPHAPATPSDGTSSISEEQTLSANDFFFVSYPFDESCAGDTASCPCGDDCQCIGCVIHNNPVPEETPGDSTPL